MKDLTKYNQKLLAIIGTLALVVIGFAIIIGIGTFIIDLIDVAPRKQDSGVVINQNQVVDTSTSSFVQNISILEPFQLDSSTPVFIIPIGHKNQKTTRTKRIDGGLSFNSYEASEDYSFSSFSGLYNNFVLIDYNRNIRMPVFKTKIAVTEWAYLKIADSQLILFKGTDTDLNKDGLLNDDDFQSLFAFDVLSLKTKDLRFKNQTVRSFEPLQKTNKIYVRTGKDINADKKFDYYNEPTDLFIYDVSTGEKETLVPEEVKIEIQDVLSK